MKRNPAADALLSKESVMKTIRAAAGAAVSLAIGTIVAGGPVGPRTANAQSQAGAVADAKGYLRVPDAYRTTYEFPGAWAAASDEGPGSQELHVVYASPGT